MLTNLNELNNRWKKWRPSFPYAFIDPCPGSFGICEDRSNDAKGS